MRRRQAMWPFPCQVASGGDATTRKAVMATSKRRMGSSSRGKGIEQGSAARRINVALTETERLETPGYIEGKTTRRLEVTAQCFTLGTS